jgi:hypothetical protein
MDPEPFDDADEGECKGPGRRTRRDRPALASRGDESSGVIDDSTHDVMNRPPDWMIGPVELSSEGRDDAGYVASGEVGVVTRNREQGADGIGLIGEAAADFLVPRFLDPFHDRKRQFFLVRELVIERATGIPGFTRHPLQHEVGVSGAGDPYCGRLQQRRSSTSSAIGLRETHWSHDISTFWLHAGLIFRMVPR